MTLVVDGTVVVDAVHTPSGTYRISGGATSQHEISEKGGGLSGIPL